MSESAYRFTRVLAPEDLPDGRVTTVSIGSRTIALTHFKDTWAALDNACPHQGGPLGEGSIECGAEDKAWLRCPWHGWDFDPITGKSPGDFGDGLTTFPVELRDDGVYVGVPDDEARTRTVSDLLAESMVAWGVKSMFGMVGHSNLGMGDAIRRQVEAGAMRYYGIRHEGAAAFAASAYGKLTGRPAACLTIAGPGATNLLTGMYDAKVDRSPLLALTGQINTQVLGPGAFQELDLQAAFADVSAFNQTVFANSTHGELVSLAMKNALLRQQPVNLVLPDEVQELPAPENAVPGSPDGRLAAQEIAPPEQALQDAVAKLRSAARPLIIVGHGARFAMEEIIALAESLQAPAATTFKGKGLIADTHPLACGVLGRSGTPIASWFMNECDVILAIGASFANHTGITPKKPIIQIDIDPMQLAKFHAIDVGLFGEIGRTVALLGAAFATPVERSGIANEVATRWKIWRDEKAKRLTEDRGEGVSSVAVFDAMNRVVQDDAIIAVDVGNNTYSFGRYFEASGQQAVLMSGYLGSIGFGYPAALGAWAATQEDDPRFAERPVWCVSGDGGFGQYMMELMTAVKYGMNITHVLLHNDELGKISKEQRAGAFEVWETNLRNCDFSKYAENCGALGIRVESASELDEALQRARDHEGPALVEVMTDVSLI
jgi:thiamine pyrophosphate-dependent acetolactate synthase large subunit-like protein/nitrite reductase/ring-hydroxylating ferredoxin subunit